MNVLEFAGDLVHMLAHLCLPIYGYIMCILQLFILPAMAL